MFHTTNLAIISRFVKPQQASRLRLSWIVIQHPGFLINEFARYLILIGAVNVDTFILVGFRASCLFRF